MATNTQRLGSMLSSSRAIQRGTPYQLQSSQELAIAAIRTDGGTQARIGLDSMTVGEYALAMEDGTQFPAVIVYYDGTEYWLADGFHRVAAAVQSGRQQIAAEVRPGTRREAVLFAVGANRTHGLRRTRQDVQRAIELMLRDPDWSQWSDREISRQVGCDHKTVGALRGRLSGEIPQGEHRIVERSGTTYAQRLRQAPPRVEPEPVDAVPEPAALPPAAVPPGAPPVNRGIAPQQHLLAQITAIIEEAQEQIESLLPSIAALDEGARTALLDEARGMWRVAGEVLE